MDKVGAKNAIDIFCGKHHSFYIDKEHKFNVSAPTHIKDLDPSDDDYVV